MKYVKEVVTLIVALVLLILGIILRVLHKTSSELTLFLINFGAILIILIGLFLLTAKRRNNKKSKSI